MKDLKQYIPHLIILIAVFLAGRLTSSDNSAEKAMKAEFERKEKAYQQAITQISARMEARAARYKAREKKWYSDSTDLINVVQAKERANKILINENKNLNYSGYDNPAMDSIDAILFGPE